MQFLIPQILLVLVQPPNQTFVATAHLQTVQNYSNELQSAFECASNDNTQTYLEAYDLDDDS